MGETEEHSGRASARPRREVVVGAPADPAGAGADLVLGPATRLLWRTADSVHLELGSRAVVVEGLSPQEAGALTVRGPSRAGAAGQLDGLDELVEAGFLWSRAGGAPGEGGGGSGGEFGGDPRLAPPHPRLAGELTALAVAHAERAAEVLAARHHAWVRLCGDPQLAVPLGAVLAASGVGRVQCCLEGSALLHHCAPGGLTPSDEGRPLLAAADAALGRAAPEVATGPQRDGRPDLTVVCDALDEDRRTALHADSAVHLQVTLGADHGVVGPLVIPGLTSCLRCADLHRCDRDPAWPALAVQLTVPGRYGRPARAAVGSLVAGLAALQALAFLDGDEPACVEASLELHLPDWQVRRRRWPVHPRCTCCPVEREQL